MASAEPMRRSGRGRWLGPEASPDSGAAELVLEPDALTLALDGAPPVRVAYRELSTIAIQAGSALLVIGEGPSTARVLLEHFGDQLGPIVRELRERRLRQRLTDRLVDLPDDPFPLVEYSAGDERGVAQLAVHGWGAVLAPVDERLTWRTVRRSGIERVAGDATSGSVEVGLRDGAAFRLLGLGAAAEGERRRWQALRDGAYADASAILATLVPDLAFAPRDVATREMLDGAPVSAEDIPDAWPQLEAAVLTVPDYAATYAELRDRSVDGATWLAIAPERPGAPDRPRAWFFVLLPGNLLAMELVTEGAHATYLYRVVPRASYAGEAPTELRAEAGSAVREVSEALVDARFLREPMALPEERLREPRHLRYRLALRELPSLRAARDRFVARLVHRDESSWAAALDDVIAWHAAARDDDAAWPGRDAQEAAVGASAALDE